MLNRFLSQFTLAVLMALPLIAEPVSHEGKFAFKDLNLKEGLFRSKLPFPLRHPRPQPPLKPCCKGPKGSRGPAGPIGPIGPTGPVGATGIAGVGPLLDYANFLTTATSVMAGEYIPFDITSVNQGSGINGTTTTPGVTVDATNTTFTIQVPGDYSINLGLNINFFASFENESAIAIYKNNVIIPSTVISSYTFIGTSIILANLQAGDTIQVRAGSTLALGTVSYPGAQTGYLSFSRVGP